MTNRKNVILEELTKVENQGVLIGSLSEALLLGSVILDIKQAHQLVSFMKKQQVYGEAYYSMVEQLNKLE